LPPERHAPASRAQVPERSSVPNPQEYPTNKTVEPDRLRLILQRLQSDFYDGTPVAEQIAAAVLVDLKDLDESPSTRSH
jgi:hypothetical protein